MTTNVKTESKRGRLLGACSGCSLPLPLRVPEVGEQSLDWVCTGCGKSYRAVFLESWPSEFLKNVRPAASQSEQSELQKASKVPRDRAAEPDTRQPHPISIAFPGHREVRCDLETSLSRQFDAEIGHGVDLTVQLHGDPFADAIRKHGDSPYEEHAMSRCVEVMHHSAEQLGELFTCLAVEQSADVRVTESISRNVLLRAAEDLDLFVSVGLTSSSASYPSQHALRVAMLAMSTGATLGWDEQTLLDLGVGCLVHDVGMLGVNSMTYESKQILSASDFTEIAKHPVLALESLQQHLDRIPESARMVAYQMHERCDGSGYPRGYKANQIHDLAKISAVADVFVALVSPRPHRPGMVPYHALEKILHDTKQCLFDAVAVRGLLTTVSLFPIGSYVMLNDGRVGRVIRSRGDQYDRPIVEVWNRSNPSEQPHVVDLSGQPELKIANALARLSH